MEGVHYAEGEELEIDDVLLSDWIGQYLAIVDIDGEVAACGPIVSTDLSGFKDLRAIINEVDEDEDEEHDDKEESPKKSEPAKASKADSPKAAAKAGQKRKKAESEKTEGAQTTESSPPKKGKGRGRGASKGPAKEASGPELDSAILKKASGLGLETALKNLAGRGEMANISADKMLTALQQSGGLINKAKASILAGA